MRRHKILWLFHPELISTNIWIDFYQLYNRVYLDEYPEQKEERENYFAGLPFCNNVSHIRSCVDTKLSITNFDGVSEYVRLDGKIDEVYINDVLVYLKQENNYFYNRWIRRN